MPEFNGDLLASMTTAPELEKRLKEEIDDVKVTMDFLTARAKAEDAYVKNLRTINQKFLKYKFEDDDDDALAAASTPQKILHGFLEFNEDYTNEVQDRAGDLEEINKAWIAKVTEQKAAVAATWKATRKRIEDTLKEAEKLEDKAYTGYQSKLKGLNKSHDSVMKSCAKPKKFWNDAEKEMKTINEAQQLHNAYVCELASLNVQYDETFKTIYPKALGDLHTMQQHHATDMQNAARKVAKAFDTTISSYADMMKKLNGKIDLVKPKEEYSQWLEDLEADFGEDAKEQIPEPKEFEMLGEAPDEHGFETEDLQLWEDTEDHLQEHKENLEGWIEDIDGEIENVKDELKEKKDAQESIPDDSKPIKEQEDQDARSDALYDKMDIQAIEVELVEKEAEKLKFQAQLDLVQGQLDANPQPEPFHDDDYYEDLLSGGLKSATMGRGGRSSTVKTPTRKSATSGGNNSPKKKSQSAKSPRASGGSGGGRGALPPPPGSTKKKKAQSTKAKTKGKVPLEDEAWFHHKISRKEVEPLLTHRGDYLVRESAKKPGELALSVKALDHDLGRDKVTHFIIQQDVVGKYRFEGDAYPSVRELVQHYRDYTMPVTKRSDAKLLHAVVRDGYDGSTEEEEDDGSNPWRLTHRDVEIGKKLGNGNFGEVFRGKMKDGKAVAVKTCKDTVPDPARFLEEADVLKEYQHPNIVQLVGVVETKPIYIVLELCLGGDLLVYLRKHASAPEITQYVRMAAEAADGMSYLHGKNCIHRDLAARNCLVTTEGVVKISDFGMSRITDGDEDIYTVDTTAKTIPIKWTAPEALERMEYTLATDVWAYGILLWEIFSAGKMPYAGMTNAETKAQVINNNYRMPAPSGTPEQIQQLMAECWQYQEKDRPTMADIVIWFEDIKAFYPEESA